MLCSMGRVILDIGVDSNHAYFARRLYTFKITDLDGSDFYYRSSLRVDSGSDFYYWNSLRVDSSSDFYYWSSL